MQAKTKYNRNLFVEILKSQRLTEQLIQEILSKACPLHGLHANIKISNGWDITTVSCCEDLNKLTGYIIHYFTGYYMKNLQSRPSSLAQ